MPPSKVSHRLLTAATPATPTSPPTPVYTVARTLPKGVYIDKSRKSNHFKSHFSHLGLKVTVGYFPTSEAAAQALALKRIEYDVPEFPLLPIPPQLIAEKIVIPKEPNEREQREQRECELPKGVCINKNRKCNPFEASFYRNGRKVYVGYYGSAVEASEAVAKKKEAFLLKDIRDENEHEHGNSKQQKRQPPSPPTPGTGTGERELPKGVYNIKDSKTNPYKSEFSFQGTRVHVGCFPTSDAALEAMRQKREELEGLASPEAAVKRKRSVNFAGGAGAGGGKKAKVGKGAHGNYADSKNAPLYNNSNNQNSFNNSSSNSSSSSSSNNSSSNNSSSNGNVEKTLREREMSMYINMSRMHGLHQHCPNNTTNTNYNNANTNNNNNYITNYTNDNDNNTLNHYQATHLSQQQLLLVLQKGFYSSTSASASANANGSSNTSGKGNGNGFNNTSCAYRYVVPVSVTPPYTQKSDEEYDRIANRAYHSSNNDYDNDDDGGSEKDKESNNSSYLAGLLIGLSGHG